MYEAENQLRSLNTFSAPGFSTMMANLFAMRSFKTVRIFLATDFFLNTPLVVKLVGLWCRGGKKAIFA